MRTEKPEAYLAYLDRHSIHTYMYTYVIYVYVHICIYAVWLRTCVDRENIDKQIAS